jgi:hypothetical protein
MRDLKKLLSKMDDEFSRYEKLEESGTTSYDRGFYMGASQLTRKWYLELQYIVNKEELNHG